MDADADTNANARGSAIALPGLRPGELKRALSGAAIFRVNMVQITDGN